MSNKKIRFPWQKPIISVQSYGKGIYLPQISASFFANCSNVSPKLSYLHTNRPTQLSFCKQYQSDRISGDSVSRVWQLSAITADVKRILDYILSDHGKNGAFLCFQAPQKRVNLQRQKNKQTPKT
ncbi:MAG: hypothetical protein ACI4T7_01715 [Alloprevotella sp.]